MPRPPHDEPMCSTTSAPVLSTRELRTSGLSRTDIGARLDRGDLLRVRRGVYARKGSCDIVRRAAAHGGSLACVSAARHLGLWVVDTAPETHVWLRPHGRSYPHDECGCVVHWDASPARDAFGIPSLPHVLRQILGCRGVEQFFVTLESARRRGMLAPSELDWLRAHTNAAGRDAIDFSRSDADSGLESLLRWRLRPHGLEIRTQVRVIAVGIVDFLIGDRLIVEVDGIENHQSTPHRHKDLLRDANAAAWGYITLRFDYAMVVHDWETVELAILSHLDRGLHRR